MRNKCFLFSLLLGAWAFFGCQTKAANMTDNKKGGKSASSVCADNCEAKNTASEITCKLTTPELRKRKETVIATLKKEILERKELPNGYAYKFAGNDQTLDMLAEFIKTERECCDFFMFNLSISGDKKEAWLQLTGAEKAKDFILSELAL